MKLSVSVPDTLLDAAATARVEEATEWHGYSDLVQAALRAYLDARGYEIVPEHYRKVQPVRRVPA